MAQDPTIPSLVVNNEQQIELKIFPTYTQLSNQGYTYNQVNFTFNQANASYGGIYNYNTDLLVNPSISGIIDIGIHPAIPPGPNNYHSVGPGWFLFITTNI